MCLFSLSYNGVSFFFFKECCFRVRVTVTVKVKADTNPKPNPNPNPKKSVL